MACTAPVPANTEKATKAVAIAFLPLVFFAYSDTTI